MRRAVFVIAVLSAALVVAPVAVAKSKADLAWGSGIRATSGNEGSPAATFTFNATSGPNGENASGTFIVSFAETSFTANVSCLDVSGTQATLFGQISVGTGAADPNTFTEPGNSQAGGPLYFVAVVRDNGKPTSRHPSPDQMSLVGWDNETGWLTYSNLNLDQICADPFGALGTDRMLGLVSGDLTVIDR